MRGIKPFKLGFLTRPFQVRRQNHLGVTVTLCFRFGDPPTIVTDVEMWELVGEELGATPVDVGVPKSRAEYLVVGACHQPSGRLHPTCPVEVYVGELAKQLYVIGDRDWVRGVPSAPAPFSTMPLDWAHAFGGEGFPANPVGKGAAPIVGPDGKEVHPLPNVEIPGRLITSPKDRPEPSSLTAVDFTWAPRMSLAGTYDTRWLETLYPGLAEDIDWRMWNAAPPDQQKDGAWRGDEPMRFVNMHPRRPHLDARLPGIHGRCFYTRRDEDGVVSPLTELPLRFTTVWAFPHREMGIALFQGAIDVTEDDGADVDTIMIAADWIARPRSFEHFRDVHARRTGADGKANLAIHLEDGDLVPEEMVGLTPETQKAMDALANEGLQAKRLRARHAKEVADGRATVEALGLDPDEHGPRMPDPDPPMPSPTELPKVLERMRQELDKHQKEMQEEKEREVARVAALYADIGLDFDEVREEMASAPEGPPAFRADELRAKVQTMADEAKASGHDVAELEFYATDEEWYRRMVDAEARLFEAYRQTAHLKHAASAKSDEASRAIRAEVEDAVRRGASLAGKDFTGADLSGMALVGADFAGAFLESTRFAGADLRDAKLDNAVLAHADLSEAKLAGASFRGANLGRCRMRAAMAPGVDLSTATIVGIDLRAADLTGAVLERGVFQETDLRGADLSRANLKMASFFEAQLSQARFVGASLENVFFYKTGLTEIDFGGVTMTEACFMDSAADGARFLNATLVKIRCVGESGSWRKADFRGANMVGANLRGQMMDEADLSGARLDKADFSGASLRGARLYRAVARESSWIRADLRGAQMVSMDLLRSSLQKADIRGTDLRGANLYAADFALVRADEGTNVTDALQTKVRSRPRRTPS